MSTKKLCWAALLSLAGFASSQEVDLVHMETTNFEAAVVRNTQLLASLKVRGQDFDFLPLEFLDRRSRDGQYHWGDITYRYRVGDNSSWIHGDSAERRSDVEMVEPSAENVLMASNLDPTLPNGPLSITREWLEIDGDLGLRFILSNNGNEDLELGSLGMPIEFNNIFTGREQTGMQEKCSLFDPYVGFDAGHLRVAPVNPTEGSSSALAVTPLDGTQTPFEAYRNLVEPYFGDTAYGSHTFEGLYEWQVLTKAWAENEWARSGQDPWHSPSSKTMKPEESYEIGVRFVAADGVRGLDDAVRKTGTPTVVGIPGYVLPRDLPGLLVLDPSLGVESFTSSPEGALVVNKESDGHFRVTPRDDESNWGRVRLDILYENGKLQTVHYVVTKPATQAVQDMGQFLFDKAWYTDENDAFNRTPSVMTYDYERGEILKQDSRAWMAGLSDEGGTGAYVAAGLKQLIQPDPEEVAKLDEFVNKTLWMNIQAEDYSVKKSLFFYEPDLVDFPYDDVDWSRWESWNREAAYLTYRAYNYVHVSAVYWTLYRISRAYPDLVMHKWDWYLEKAWGSGVRIGESDIRYGDLGLMGETVWGKIIDDLVREGEDDKAEQLISVMRRRTEHWNTVPVPYGSEAPWDSTGQEGVYFWARRFGFDDLAKRTVDSVLGYTPSVPHWAWNGNARRYWDFDVAGKLRRIERQIHNYGSALNAQVLIDAFRDNPEDSYLMRVAYGGSLAPITNINQEGFPSTGFHAWPDTMKWDGSTGDYGGAFLGMSLNGGVVVSDDSEAGLVAFGGVLQRSDGAVTVTVKDPVRQRVYIGPLSLLIEIDMGQISEVSYTEGSVTISVTNSYQGPDLEAVVVWLDSRSTQQWEVSSEAITERGGWKCSLIEGKAEVTIDIK